MLLEARPKTNTEGKPDTELFGDSWSLANGPLEEADSIIFSLFIAAVSCVSNHRVGEAASLLAFSDAV
ncbi:unnamed protein product [Schistosoma guineensis]|nr:unnamed protein product [Schistosoma guineensis]